MASAISKRQQARNERALTDLVRNVPGNDRCADCSAKNPGWASWNLGLFLCMRCAGLHRKLGTHVSKVKSLSMDSWTTEQVETMKKMGNAEGNKRYNPRNVRADLPIDADEVEPAMERYIRQKYEQRAFSAGGGGSSVAAAPMRQNTGSTSTGSWNEEPPALPPKPTKRFGFSLRSSSSTLPRQSKKDRNFTPPLSPTFSDSDRSGQDAFGARQHKESKPSRMFGMKITGVSNNFDSKLATLRDMGFSDNRSNSDALKSSNGNLDRAIEMLVSQGEGSSSAPAAQAPAARALTPVSMTSSGFAGITIDKTRQAEPKANKDPWEIREQSPKRAATQPLPEPSVLPQPQSAAPAPAQNTWNPYMSQQAPQALENSFQNLQVSQTGPAQMGVQQGYGQQAMYQNTSFPQQPHNYDQSQAGYQNNPGLQQSQSYGQPAGFQNNGYPEQLQNYSQQQPVAVNNGFPQQYGANPWGAMTAAQNPQGPSYQQAAPTQQPYQQAAPTQEADPSSNPFLRRAVSQTLVPSNPWAQQAPAQAPMPSQPMNNPWAQPAHTGYGGQQQPAFEQSPTPVQPTQLQPQQTSNPWQPMMSQPTGMPQQQFYGNQTIPQYQQAPPPQPPQEQSWTYTPKDAVPSTQPGRHDKSSILALYSSGFAQGAAPMQSLPEESQAMQAQNYQHFQGQQFQPAPSQFQPAPRSVTMPVQPTSGNPFMQQQQQPTAMSQQGSRHVSNESAAFMGMGGDGRHSPDAFSGLSARYVR